MENEIEEKKLAGVLKSEETDEGIVVTIVKQTLYNFSSVWYFKDGNRTERRIDDFDYKIKIASINCVEYFEDGNIIEVFIKGNSDSSIRNKKFTVSNRELWLIIKECFEELGFLVDKDEDEEVEKDTEKMDLSNQLGEPTDEEIDKMISLVDIKTFGLIIKNRLFKFGSADKKTIFETITDELVKKYLRTWAVSKYRFYKMFGDKLKVDKEIEVAPDTSLVRQEMNDLKREFPLYRAVFDSVSDTGVAKNEISKSYTWDSYFEDKRVKEGMKFTKFISLFGNKDLDMALSKLYQNLGKTTISISIDPIDFLTVSINNSGWKSCHNFFDGCYRNATLSYMNDETSLVSYIGNKKLPYSSYELPFEWNSKRWRQMVYVSKNSSAVAFSRQYPNTSNEVAKEVRNLFEEVFSNYFNVENKWKVFNSCSNGGVSVDNGSRLIYNDISNGYEHRLIKNVNDINYLEKDTIKIGASVMSINNEYEEVKGSEDTIWW